MKTFPIIPIWLMLIICTIVIIYIIIKSKNLIQIIIIIILFIVNMRIMIPKNITENNTNNLDILFVIDTTLSMNTLDYNKKQTRLSGVKDTCMYIIDKLNGSRFSVITFDNSSRTIIPYTNDSNITKQTIKITSPINEQYANGTSMDVAFNSIISSLKISKKKNNNQKIIFFFSDGENTNNNKMKNFNKISKYINDGAVLGYGTTKGSYIKSNSNSNNQYVMDYTNNKKQKAISKIDEKNLKYIAKEMNIDYIHITSKEKIKTKINKIKYKTKDSINKNNITSYYDLYYIFIIPLFILLLIEFNKFRRKSIWENY